MNPVRRQLREYCQALRRQLRRLVCQHEDAKEKVEGGAFGVYYVVRLCPRCQKKKKQLLRDMK
jgi:predicted esterase YcpF (UPF0227 family)